LTRGHTAGAAKLLDTTWLSFLSLFHVLLSLGKNAPVIRLGSVKLSGVVALHKSAEGRWDALAGHAAEVILVIVVRVALLPAEVVITKVGPGGAKLVILPVRRLSALLTNGKALDGGVLEHRVDSPVLAFPVGAVRRRVS